MGHQDAEAHAGYVEHALGHHEAHGEEQVGRRDEGENNQRQSLMKRHESQESVWLSHNSISTFNANIL